MSKDLASRVDPFCRDALDRFRERVGNLLREDLEIAEAIADAFTRRAIRSFVERGDADLAAVAADLHRTGIGARWNAELGAARSAVLARWIAPHIEGSVLDLLCGTGGIGDALRARGVAVTLSERQAGHVADHMQHRSPFCPMEQLERQHSGPRYGTVLLCTVLHHEEDAEGLLALGARLARRRLIVVENCMESQYPAEYQLLMDVFFNRCLNPNALPSPGHHRSAADWARAASAFGDLLLVARKQRGSRDSLDASHDRTGGSGQRSHFESVRPRIDHQALPTWRLDTSQ